MADHQQSQMAMGGAHLTVVKDEVAQEMKSMLAWKYFTKAINENKIEVLVYAFFLIIFTMLITGSREGVYTYMMHRAVYDVLLGTEWAPFPYFFADVESAGDFYTYMENAFLPVVFDPWDPSYEGRHAFLYGANALVGPVRMRQLRVEPEKCAGSHPILNVFDRVCYPTLAEGKESTASYAVGTGPYQYQTPQETSTWEQFAYIDSYPGGGFVEDFSGADNTSVNMAKLFALRDNKWIDLQTRAVILNFAFYNAAYNEFEAVSLFFEFLPDGSVYPSARFDVLKLIRKPSTGKGYAVAVGEIFVAIFVMGFFVEELVQMYLRGVGAYFFDSWNILDIVNAVLFFAVFAIRIQADSLFRAVTEDPEDTEAFYPLQIIATLDRSERNLLAINAFFLWFKVFKYTKYFPDLSIINRTIAASVKNTLSFLVMFFFVILGFVSAGYVLFGTQIQGFSKFSWNLFTTFNAALGDIDYDAMREADRTMGPLFFVVFVVLVLFILLSMFFAILGESYSAAQEEAAEKGSTSLASLMGDKLKHTSVFAACLDQAQQVKEENGIELETQLLEMKDLRKVVQKHRRRLREHLNVADEEDLVARFDIELPLSLESQRDLIDALERKDEEDTAVTVEVLAQQVIQIQAQMDDTAAIIAAIAEANDVDAKEILKQRQKERDRKTRKKKGKGKL